MSEAKRLPPCPGRGLKRGGGRHMRNEKEDRGEWDGGEGGWERRGEGRGRKKGANLEHLLLVLLAIYYSFMRRHLNHCHHPILLRGRSG